MKRVYRQENCEGGKGLGSGSQVEMEQGTRRQEKNGDLDAGIVGVEERRRTPHPS